jgi:hypothetical protein
LDGKEQASLAAGRRSVTLATLTGFYSEEWASRPEPVAPVGLVAVSAVSIATAPPLVCLALALM